MGGEGRMLIFFVYAIVMISFLDTFSQLPIISPYAQDLGAGSLMMGLIVGMYSFSNMIGNIGAGQWIDRIGRKKILIFGMLIAAFSLLFYAFVTNPMQLLSVRFVHGIGGGLMIPAVFAYLGDRTGTDNRGKSMALSGAAIGVSAILGPAFGGLVTAYWGIEWVFYMISILLFVTAVCVYYKLPETYEPLERGSLHWQEWVKLLSHSKLVIAYMAAFSLMFTLGIVSYMLPLKVGDLGFSSAITGLLLSTYGIIAIIIFLLPTNLIADRWGRMKPILTGLTLIFCALILLSLFSQIALLVAVMALYGVGFALLFPAMTALVIDHTQKVNRGRAFGLFYAFFSLGVVIGPVFVGLWDVTPDQGFVLGAAGLAVLITIMIMLRKRSE